MSDGIEIEKLELWELFGEEDDFSDSGEEIGSKGVKTCWAVILRDDGHWQYTWYEHHSEGILDWGATKRPVKGVETKTTVWHADKTRAV